MSDGRAPGQEIVQRQPDQGSVDGVHWTTVDQRTGAPFTWRQQTRAFTAASPGSFSYYRIQLAAGSTPIRLSEIELLGTA